MKNRKWLLIIVSIVMVVNLAFFFLIRLSVVDKMAEEKVSGYLAEALQAEVRFGSFSFNDRQLRISHLNLSGQDMELRIDQIYIEYNLAQLLLSNFKHLHAIRHIKIFEPELHYTIKPSESVEKVQGSAGLPDIAGYFRKLNIYNGRVKLAVDLPQIKLEKELQKLNLSIVNNTDTQLILHCLGSKTDSLFAQVNLARGELRKAVLHVSEFDLSGFKIDGIQDFTAVLDLELDYRNGKLQYSGALNNIGLSAYERTANSEAFSLRGDDEKLACHFSGLRIDGNEVQFSAEIEKLLSADRQLSAEISAHHIPLHKYAPEVQGFADFSATAKGKADDLVILFAVGADSISGFEQTLADIQINGRMQDEMIAFSLENAVWEGNTITGNGDYQIGRRLKAKMQSNALNWQYGEHRISGDLSGNVSFDDDLTVGLVLSDCVYQSNGLTLSNLTLHAGLYNRDFTLNLMRPQSDLQVNCRGFLEPPAVEAKIRFKRFDLRNIFSDRGLPVLSGNLDITANEFSLLLDSDLRAYDQDFGKLNGRVIASFAADLTNEKTELNLRTFNSRFNYENFDVNLRAEGTLDSIGIREFTINKIINIDGWCRLKPDLQYGVSVQGTNVRVREIAKYFMNYYAYSELQGNADLQLHYDSRDGGLAEGSVYFDKIHIGGLKDFSGQLRIGGNHSRIRMYDSFVDCGDERIMDIAGDISLQPELDVQVSGSIPKASLQKVFPTGKLKGSVSGAFSFQKDAQSQSLTAEMTAENLKSNNLKVDSVKLKICQEDSLLTIHELNLSNDKLFRLNGSGAIGYNFLTSTVYPDSNSIEITFEGDLLELLAEQSEAVRVGKSQCTFNLRFGMKETGIFIDDCRFDLSKGKLNLKDQPSEIDKIIIAFYVENDILNLTDFELKTGDGKLVIINEITNSETDLKLGSVNLGKLKVKTNSTGLMAYIPQYTPKNSFLNAVIGGRNSEYLEITGPFDDLKIVGDVTVSNGNLIYPPDTDNLLNLFNLARTERKDDSEAASLPIGFDVLLHVGENVRYVTFPMNVKVIRDGYLHLRYTNGEFQKPDALFTAEEGSVDMFGTTLILDYMQIQLSQFGSGVIISGIFYKKAADGTLITLEIYNDSADGSLGELKFALKSDNPSDLITDILAKLRFNRTMDEISPAQKKSLLQDEVIQIAGLGIESAVLDPLISPVENTIRQILRLDYFHLQTDLIQNLFASYSSESKSEYTISEEQSQVDRFTSEMFLNNLSVSAGKYLTRKLFFDYEFRLVKEDQIVTKNYLGIFQDFKLRYDLPLKFKISYQYLILPFDANQHQIGIERSFKF